MIFFVKLLNDNRVRIINASWIRFKKNAKPITNVKVPSKRPCKNILSGIYINPYSQMLSCCGLTVEYNRFLKLGDLNFFSVKDLYERQFLDFYKIWLFIEGPLSIYEKVMKIRNLEIKSFNHDCAYCMELVKDKENIEILNSIVWKELPHILFSYLIDHTRFSKGINNRIM